MQFIMKILLFVFCILLSALAMRAQSGTFSLNLDGGYNYGSTIDFDITSAKPHGAFQWGGGFEYFIFRDQSIELKYLRSSPDIELIISKSPVYPNSAGSFNYILLGWNKYFVPDPEAKFLPYVGFGLGMNKIDINDNISTKFSWDAKLGVKIKTKSAVSLKLQAYLQHTNKVVTYDVWYGWNGYPVTDYYGALWQVGIGGVLCFDFRKK
jgi:hypothetical protein